MGVVVSGGVGGFRDLKTRFDLDYAYMAFACESHGGPDESVR